MLGSMRYRLPAESSDTPDMRRYMAAMSRLKSIDDNRGFEFIAGLHGVPSGYCWHHQFSPKTPLQARLFLPWHRAYLWHLEQALLDVADRCNGLQDGVALNWWDWSASRSNRENSLPDAYTVADFEDPTSPKDDRSPNPLRSTTFVDYIDRKWGKVTTKTTFRGYTHAMRTLLPSTEQIEHVLAIPDWTRFSDTLQSMHDAVHGWVGGSMADTGIAAFDPLFFAHHAMVDAIWARWQVMHGENSIPMALWDLELRPFGMRVKDVLSTPALGYEYGLNLYQLEPEYTRPVSGVQITAAGCCGDDTPGVSRRIRGKGVRFAAVTPAERPDQEFRAELQVYGINTLTNTFVANVYVNDAVVDRWLEHQAAEGPPQGAVFDDIEFASRSAGAFGVFGHSECWGSEGHCDALQMSSRRRFDTRASHPLTPAFRRVDITDAVRDAIESGETLRISMTVHGGVLECEGVQIAICQPDPPRHRECPPERSSTNAR